MKKVACLMIINKNNELLLQNRESISKYWEEWSFFWWWIEEWESHFEAAKREAEEELSLELDENSVEYLWVVENRLEYMWKTKDYIRYIYKIVTDRKETDFIDLEWDGAKFFNLDDVKNLKFNTSILKELKLLSKNL